MSVSANSLDLATIAAALDGAPIGHTIDYRRQVSSTMVIARQHAADPAMRSGTIVIADEQTAGRGRGTRQWQVPAGAGLMCSLILKAPIPAALPQISMLAGLTALAAITAQHPALVDKVGLKWPNDLLLGNDMHDACKVGGILVESAFYGSALDYVIIGLGINLLQQPAALPAVPQGAPAPTSIAHFLTAQAAVVGAADTGRPPDRTALLIALCHAWAQQLDPLPTQAASLARWRAALWTLGQQVVIYPNTVTHTTYVHAHQTDSTDADGTIHGRAIDVTANGELIVQDKAGNIHTFAAGDVSVRMR